MKYLLVLALLLFTPLFALDSEDNNTTNVEQEKEEIIEIKDTSGLSEDEIRDVAEVKDDIDEQKDVKTDEVIKAIIESGYEDKVDISQIQAPWEEMSPTPKKYDWVQTKSGEWFKGEIKAMYDDSLEFDSDEVGLYTFDFEDIVQIKSYNIIGVNIENVAVFIGIVRFKDDEITIIQGDKTFKFDKKEIISFAPEGNRVLNSWSGKITLNIDVRYGNKDQFEYVAKANIKRRTSETKLYFDYLGRISSKNGEEYANDHRINQKYDRYITRNFFWTPLFSEYYSNKYTNIKNQVEVGVGLGYTILNNSWIEWDVSGGPAYTYIEYISVMPYDDIHVTSPALDFSTKLDIELTKKIDFIYDYKLTIADKAAGRYKHHMVGTLENELTSWLDLDITAIWDYLELPERKSDGTVPLQDDFQFLIGLGVEF